MRLRRLLMMKMPEVVLEFGCGLSTGLMSDALKRNEAATSRVGTVHAVETAQAWTDMVLRTVPPDLAPYVEITTSDAE